MDILEWIFNALVYIINVIIWLFAAVLKLVLSILPNSPFLSLSSTYDISVGKYMPYLSWFLPIKSMLGILIAWLGCMLIYYIYSVVMRWIKLID